MKEEMVRFSGVSEGHAEMGFLAPKLPKTTKFRCISFIINMLQGKSH
jgi:hypothetical protein